jgi:hypothetical protein
LDIAIGQLGFVPGNLFQSLKKTIFLSFFSTYAAKSQVFILTEQGLQAVK